MKFKTFYLDESRNYPTDIELYEKYKGQDVYYSYRSIDKLGINPNSKYDTPNGIYAYPVKYQDPDVKFTGDTNSGFVYFFKLKPGTKILDLGNYKKKDFESDITKLKENNIYSEWDYSKANVNSPAGHLWFATYMTRGNSNKWNHLLRKVLGYDAVLDRGSGIIHNHEPSQIVVLNPTSIEIVEKGMFDKRLDFEKLDIDKIRTKNGIKYISAFIDNLKRKTPNKKVLDDGMFIKIINNLNKQYFEQFIDAHIDDIELRNLSLFDSNLWDLSEEDAKNILILLEPIVDKLINKDPRQISYFPKEYQMELIKHFKLSFPDAYSTLYAIGYIKDLDDKIEFIKMFPKFVIREIESTPSGIFNYFKTDKVHVDKMLKVVDVFKNSIKKMDDKTKKYIYGYFARYANEDQKTQLKKMIDFEWDGFGN